MRYATPKQAAAELGLHEDTVRLWVREGKLPHLRLGARFIRIDMDAAIERLRAEAAAQTAQQT